jgi:DNA repair exonuclease SbcCD ATPase subunit
MDKNTEIMLKPEQEAVLITERIKDYGKAAVNAVCNIGRELRRMKIEGLYVHLGYETFEEYTEKEFNFKRRQAYLYISVYEDLGEEFVQSNAQLGITKLALLTQLNNEDRTELMQSEDIAGMTTREVEELVSKYKEQGEQLSMLQEENAALKEELDLEPPEVEEMRRAKLEAERRVKSLEERIKKSEEIAENYKSYSDKLLAENEKRGAILSSQQAEIHDLKKKYKELEERPVDVQVAEPVVKEVIKEVSDKKAIEKKDKEIAKLKKKMEELEASRDEQEQERVRQQEEYEARIEAMKKAAEKPAEPADKSSFKAMFASAYKEITGLIEFVKEADEKDKPVFTEKVRQLLSAVEKALKEAETDVDKG